MQEQADISAPLSLRETILAQNNSSDGEESAISSVPVEQGTGSILQHLQSVFAHIPGANDALQSITVEESEDSDAAVVDEVINRLMTLPVIEGIVGDRREHLATIVQGAVGHGIQTVNGSVINTTVLADPHQQRYALLQPLGSGAFGYVAEAEFDSDFTSEPEAEANDGNGQPEAEANDGNGKAAEDPYGDPEFVAKILLDTGKTDSTRIFRRFQSEQETLATIQSGAPAVYAEGMAGPRPYFVMRKIPGQDFHDVVWSINHAMQHDEKNDLQWPSQWMYLALASANQTMHEIHSPEGATEIVTDDARLSKILKDETVDLKEKPVGVVHRDLKPSNIRIDSEGRVWILDFGLVRPMDSDVERTRLTQTGQIMGTPQYMAPEQVQASKFITPASDVYAMGCVAFEMLSGIPPFAYEDTMISVLRAHVDKSPNFDLIPNPKARAIVMRMMHKDPAQRPDLGQVAQEFHALYMEGAGEAERKQYAEFLSQSHVERKLSMPDDLDFTAPVERNGNENGQSLSLTKSFLTQGGDDLPDIGPGLPEVYVVVNGKNVKLTNTVRFWRWVKEHPRTVNLGIVAATVAAVFIPVAAYFSLRKPDTSDPTALVERLPGSSISLDIDDNGRIVGVEIFDESPVQIPAEDIETVKADGETSGAMFHFGSEQVLTAMGSEDPSVLPESIRERGWTTGMVLNGVSEGEDGSSPGKVIYIGGKMRIFFVDSGSGRISMYTDNTTLLNRRSGECERWEGLDKVYDDATFRAIVMNFPEVNEELGDLLNSRGDPTNSLSSMNGQVRAWRSQLEEREPQTTQPNE